MLFTLVPLSVFFAYSLKQLPNVNWTTPVWLAIVPCIARHFTLVSGSPVSRVELFVRRLWAPVMILVVISYGAIFHYLAIGLPHVPYRADTVKPVAWKQLGRDVEKIEQEIKEQTGDAPTVVGMDKYNLASELAFYRSDSGDHTGDDAARTTSRHLFGGDALMYERWDPPARQEGKTLLLVSFKPERLSDGRISELTERVGPIQERAITKLGVPAGRYFYRVAYGYRGKPEKLQRMAPRED
jgi:dolichol-phosphate mannosyltransferase